MTGVNHDDAIAKRQRRPEQQRFEIFLQIEAVDKNLVVNEFRGETEIDFRAVPGLLRGCRCPKPSCRSPNRSHKRPPACGQQMRLADFVFGGPAIERSPRCHRRRRTTGGSGGWRHRSAWPRRGEFFYGVGIRPVQRGVFPSHDRRRRNGFLRNGGCGGTPRQKNRRADKDGRWFEHPVIVRMLKPDSS